ncbi:WD40 repeat domain-containing protein [Shewanella sp. 10N.286.48.B5]|uniref:WD40 repeat domain-containing protein n=1 Tax=Shewanella sp. 10N.286.48.B5 TaxID=1880834 RepID=UPI000C832C96|nr:WD40 repeat domain-containing protein [Shewanella sp. 10N.286.48.B5]PMH85211.1 hypothetical protein BCU57_15235 [Shewanella sp. 10N.286.48.B5]
MLRQLKVALSLLTMLFCASVQAQQTYDDGARWAFVTDAKSAQLAIIDTFNFTLVEHKKLAGIPVDMVVSDVQSLLVYAIKNDPSLYIWDLSNNKTWSMALGFQAQSLKFHSNGAMLAVAGKDQVTVVEPLTQKVVKHINNLASPISLNFSSDGYRLMITQETNGATHIWNVYHDSLKTITMGNGNPVSEITLTPDSRLGMVSIPKDHKVHIWDFISNKDWKWLDFDAEVARPYVTSDSQHIVLAANNGNIKIIDAYSKNTIKELNIGAKANKIRTGWLERVAAVESRKGLHIFNLKGDNKITLLPTEGHTRDMVVVSDSKSMFSSHDNSSDIKVVDLRKLSGKTDIKTQLIQPNHIVMGLTNTICH